MSLYPLVLPDGNRWRVLRHHYHAASFWCQWRQGDRLKVLIGVGMASKFNLDNEKKAPTCNPDFWILEVSNTDKFITSPLCLTIPNVWGKDSWHYIFHYCCCLVYSRLIFIDTNLCNCSCDCCIVILCRVFIVCVVLCAVFRLIVVLFCVMCVICVLCLIVVPLPPGRNPFAVKINK
jgi:hypothetical protein